MNIKIYYQISETERDVYEFFIQNNFQGKLRYSYLSYWKSFRDEDHPWGDEWTDFYRDEENQKTRELECQFLAENGYEYEESWTGGDFEWDMKFVELRQKYNPIMNKTAFGKPFLGGCSGPNKPLPLIPEKELIEQLNNKLTVAMADATIVL